MLRSRLYGGLVFAAAGYALLLFTWHATVWLDRGATGAAGISPLRREIAMLLLGGP